MAENERRRQSSVRDVTLAWMMANFRRAKRLPDLSQILRNMEKESQTVTDKDVQATKQYSEIGKKLYEIAKQCKKSQPAEKRGR